jgi:hypothetical protein
MMHSTRTIRNGFAILFAAGALFLSNAGNSVVAQESEAKSNKKLSQQGGRDPFTKYVPPRPRMKSTGLVMPPSVQERVAQYKIQKQAAMSARVAAPKPTTAFLLNEIQVVGISRSPRGYAAIVEAMPIKLSYVIYPGERFYDGQLVAIEDNRLVFRRETVFNDGRREKSVEMKTLRQANIGEAMTASKPAPTTSTVAASEKLSEEKASADKP